MDQVKLLQAIINSTQNTILDTIKPYIKDHSTFNEIKGRFANPHYYPTLTSENYAKVCARLAKDINHLICLDTFDNNIKNILQKLSHNLAQPLADIANSLAQESDLQPTQIKNLKDLLIAAFSSDFYQYLVKSQLSSSYDRIIATKLDACLTLEENNLIGQFDSLRQLLKPISDIYRELSGDLKDILNKFNPLFEDLHDFLSMSADSNKKTTKVETGFAEKASNVKMLASLWEKRTSCISPAPANSNTQALTC